MGDVVDIAEGAKPKRTPKKLSREWEGKLRRNYKDEVLPTLGAAVLILSKHEAWQGVLSFDLLAGRVKPRKAPPFLDAGAPFPTYWSDEFTDRASNWIEQHYQAALSHETMARALRLVAEENPVHPIREYLDALVWDRKRRLDKWLVKHVRVADSPYVRAIGSKWLISAVARAYVPGCKADYVLILEGDQRCGKSSVLRALCHDEGWFLETSQELGNKDAYITIRKKWLVELAELDSLSRSELSRVKAFITARVDSYVPKYGREAVDQPRAVIFAGTTNERVYLKDETGGDRWWPVFTSATRENRLDPQALLEVRDQLWAEAVHRYRRGEPWHITDPEILRLAAIEQEARRQTDPLQESIAAYLRNRTEVSVADVLAHLGYQTDRVTVADSMRVQRALVGLRWAFAERTSRDGKRVKVYRPRSPLTTLSDKETPPKGRQSGPK